MMKFLFPVLLLIFHFSQSQATEKIIACGHQDYPPFMWKEGNRIEGLGVTVASQIFNELKVDVEALYVGNWKRCLNALRIGSVDLVVAAYITDERKAYAEFTQIPLSPDPSSIFVWKGNEFTFEKWDDLKGKRMASLLGDSLGQKFDIFIAKHLEDFDVNSRIQLYKMLEAGRVDFVPSGHYAGLLQLKKYGYEGRIIPLKVHLTINHLHMAISKRSKYLKYLPYLNRRLQELNVSGDIERLIEDTTDRYAKAYNNF